MGRLRSSGPCGAARLNGRETKGAEEQADVINREMQRRYGQTRSER
jgi:hypothetical protein